MTESKKYSEKGKKILESDKLLYDTPLRDPDRQDRLGRADFSKFLAQAILKMDADEGFVFSLNGPWGSGKTTVINFVLHYIEREQKEPKDLIIIRFNPWWFSGREQLLLQFFSQFRAALGKKDVGSELKEVGKKLENFSKVLIPFTLIPTVGGLATIAKDVLKGVGTASKGAGEELGQDVYEIRRSIDSLLRKQNGRILVIIDDIDRLPLEEIRQIFQLIKAVADFPKTIYFLAFDRKVVTNALKDLQGIEGENFLEKIVQAQFDLPCPDRTSLRRLFFELLEDMFRCRPEEQWNEIEWGNLFWDGIDPLIQTPRDIKRLINILRPTFPLVQGEVNPVDFIGIQVLRIFVPEMYTFISSNKKRLAGVESLMGRIGGSAGDVRKIFESVVNAIPERKQEPSIKIMKRLFPRWAAAYGGMTYGSDWLEGWRRDLRVCSPEIFDRYFLLSVPPGDISSAEMQAILNLANDPEAFSKELLRLSEEYRPDGATRLSIFLERMWDYTERDIPEGNIEPILRAIYKVGDQLYIETDKVGILADGNSMRLLRIIHRLLKRLNTQDERFNVLKKGYEYGHAISLIVEHLGYLGREHGKYSEKESKDPLEAEEERTISPDHLSRLEEIVLNKIRDSSRTGELRKAPDLGRILFLWSLLSSKDEVQDWVANLIKDDKGLCDFLVGFLWNGHSQGLDDRVGKLRWRILIQSMEKFLKVKASDLLPRCKKILEENPAWLDEKKRLALTTLQEEITNPLDEWGRPIKDDK